MSFARKLHDLRIRHKLSLQYVADKVAISKAHVFNLEKGITAALPPGQKVTYHDPKVDATLKVRDFHLHRAERYNGLPDLFRPV